MPNTSKSKGTPKVDYAPEVQSALDLIGSAATASKTYGKRGREVILPANVEATRAALRVGILASPGETGEAPPWRIAKVRFAEKFQVAQSEVTFWCRGARYLDAGGSVGDELWLRLMTTVGKGTKVLLAKRTEVGQVIDAGGSLAEIAAECDRLEKAPGGKGKGKGKRTPKPDGKGKGESAEVGVPTSADPVADARLCILGLEAAIKRIPHDDTDSFRAVKAAAAKVIREQTAARKAWLAPKVTEVETLEATG